MTQMLKSPGKNFKAAFVTGGERQQKKVSEPAEQ
jgi:hypothetical protein